jgi:hypothetical protein
MKKNLTIDDRIDIIFYDIKHHVFMYAYFFFAFLLWLSHGGLIWVRARYFWEILRINGEVLVERSYEVIYPSLIGD